jgi:uncharacterized damage-inducible protein DinB
MTELEQVLIGDSAAAPPAHILEALPDELAHKKPLGAPHSIYEELWHIAFWQQMTLDWVTGVETPFPLSPNDGFPTVYDAERETWNQLRVRFFEGAQQAAAIAANTAGLDSEIRCPSRPGEPVRIMSVRDQLENLGAHNHYHFGRIVLLRQMQGSWPPPSGGYSW